jgi:hypothetical protein
LAFLGHWGLVHPGRIADNSTPPVPGHARNIDESQPEDLPELTINTYDNAKSYEAQLRLIDKVCEVMKKNEASRDMANKVFLAIVSRKS